MNYAGHYGVGVSRAVSAGNAAAVGVADYLEFYADDPATTVGLAYVEGVPDGRALRRAARGGRRADAGRAREGRRLRRRPRAAASHTGSLASDDRVFDGDVPPGRRRAGRHHRGGLRRRRHLRHPAAAEGPRVVVVTTAGGWGVVTADAITRRRLELAAAARRPAGGARQGAAAALEPQQPDRPGRRRDPRHDPEVLD